MPFKSFMRLTIAIISISIGGRREAVAAAPWNRGLLIARLARLWFAQGIAILFFLPPPGCFSWLFSRKLDAAFERMADKDAEARITDSGVYSWGRELHDFPEEFSVRHSVVASWNHLCTC